MLFLFVSWMIFTSITYRKFKIKKTKDYLNESEPDEPARKVVIKLFSTASKLVDLFPTERSLATYSWIFIG